MPLRCALYARYSSDQQRAASVEDQFRICRERAGREGWKIEETYHDAALSGASVILRRGIQALLEGARGGRFDVVVAEALDRVSRDQADVAVLYKHLCFAGVALLPVESVNQRRPSAARTGAGSWARPLLASSGTGERIPGAAIIRDFSDTQNGKPCASKEATSMPGTRSENHAATERIASPS